MREEMYWLVGVLGALLIAAAVTISVVITAIVADATTRDELPRCHENQMLEGFGFFERGHWSEYTCADIREGD